MSAVQSAPPATHVPYLGPSSRPNQSSTSTSHFQQLLQAKLTAEKLDTSIPPPTTPSTAHSAPINQTFDELSGADTVFTPSFMGQHYQSGPVFAGTQTQTHPTTEWQFQESRSQVPATSEAVDSFRQSLELPGQIATPMQQRPVKMPEYALWREHGGRSPQSMASTPSMMTSSSMSSVGRPTSVLDNTPISPLVSQFGMIANGQQSLASLKESPSTNSIPLHPQGIHTAYAEMNGSQVPGIIQAASNEDDSLNLNNLGGDGQDGGGYDQGGYGGDGHGGYGGDDHYGDHGNGGYGPPGGNGAGGSGGEGNDPGEGPPPPPKGKKLQLACHFCRRRKLKCDGVRPVCANCAKRGETCLFDDSVRRRGPGKRTKDMRQRSGHSMNNHDGSFGAFVLNDPHNPLAGSSHDPSHPSTPDLGQMAAAASANQHHQQVYHESNMPSANLPEIDPNIDPALAILGMGMDSEHPSHSPIPPATLAEADPTRGLKRKSDLTGEDDGKRLKLEDETYEGTIPHGTDLSGVDVGGVGVGVGAVDVGDIPGFAAWNPDTLTGEGREGEVDEADLAKFENDLRRVIQDQADAEAQASGHIHAHGHGGVE